MGSGLGPLPSLSQEHALHADDYLADLSHANRSPHTRRAYGADLVSFARFYHGPAPEITPEVLRAFFATIAHLAPATRARKEAAIASFLGWAYRHDLIPGNPMGKVERVHLEPPTPRGIPLGQVDAILAVIPAQCRRDRLLSA